MGHHHTHCIQLSMWVPGMEFLFCRIDVGYKLSLSNKRANFEFLETNDGSSSVSKPGLQQKW